jgi:hypothetical protein
VSAWVVTRAHIDVLVLASVQFAVPFHDTDPARPVRLSPQQLAAVGGELWAENHRSVNHRYDERTEPPAYPPPTAEVLLDPVAVVKAIDCYVYQSGEHPGWNGSRAQRFCQRLRVAVLSGLPLEPWTPGFTGSYPVGWAHVPWGIDDLAQAAAGTVSAGGTR